MKNGLPIKPLKSLCDDFKQDIVDGPFGSELQRKDYITQGVPVLKIQNVKPFAIELKKMDYVSPAKFNELRRHSFRRGDIVMTKLGKPLGASAIVEDLDEGVFVADLVRIRAQQINTKFLCYHLNSQRTNDFINSMQKGTTRPRVTLSVVRELPIYSPPLAEQQRIVGLLDKAFAGLATAKANAEKNLKNARALFESHLQFVFTKRGKGWVEKTIADSFRVSSGDFLPARAMVESGGFDVYGGNGINGRHNQKNMSGENIIIGRVGAKCGNVHHVEGNAWVTDNALYISEYLCPFDLGFLTRLLRHKDLRSKANQMAQPVISYTTIKDVSLEFPASKVEQEKISSSFDTLEEETERLASLYERKLAALETLKRSLLHQAFTGSL